MAEHSTSDGETGEPFEAARPDYRAAQDDSLVLDLDGFEGPIDVLLTEIEEVVECHAHQGDAQLETVRVDVHESVFAGHR